MIASESLNVWKNLFGEDFNSLEYTLIFAFLYLLKLVTFFVVFLLKLFLSGSDTNIKLSKI